MALTIVVAVAVLRQFNCNKTINW